MRLTQSTLVSNSSTTHLALMPVVVYRYCTDLSRSHFSPTIPFFHSGFAHLRHSREVPVLASRSYLLHSGLLSSLCLPSSSSGPFAFCTITEHVAVGFDETLPLPQSSVGAAKEDLLVHAQVALQTPPSSPLC
jgi:hypothetical protein